MKWMKVGGRPEGSASSTSRPSGEERGCCGGAASCPRFPSPPSVAVPPPRPLLPHNPWDPGHPPCPHTPSPATLGSLGVNLFLSSVKIPFMLPIIYSCKDT